jgi:guanylate kinase
MLQKAPYHSKGETLMELIIQEIAEVISLKYQEELNRLFTEESIDLRLATCEAEMAHIKYYDYLVVNNDVNEALEKVRSIIQAERCSLNNIIVG